MRDRLSWLTWQVAILLAAAAAALVGSLLVYAGWWAPGVTLALLAAGVIVLVGRARP